MQTVRPQMPQKMSSDPFLAGTSKALPAMGPSEGVEASSWTPQSLQTATFASPTKSSLLKQSGAGRPPPSSHQSSKNKSSPSSSSKSFLSSSISKKLDKNGKPSHLPNLNLSSIKKYAGWSGSPVQPPTPLAHPPTPLAVPPSSSPTFFTSGAVGAAPHASIAALKMSRSDGKKGSDMLHPFAISSASTPQYMVYNLESNATTPLSPPPSPNAELAEPSTSTEAPPAATMDICTPPKPAPTAAKEDKAPPIPASAKFLAEHGVAPEFAAQYDIIDELGSGGFGFVVRARRISDGLTVAVKFIFRHKVSTAAFSSCATASDWRTSPKIPSHGWVRTKGWNKLANGQLEGAERLIPFEAYVLRMVRHRGVVAFLDLIEDERVFYLVMEHHGNPWVIPDRDSNNNKSAPCTLGASPGNDEVPEISFASDMSGSPASSTGPPTPISPLPPTKLAPPPMLRRSSCDLFECIEQHSRLPEDQARFVFGQIVDVVHYLATMGICHRRFLFSCIMNDFTDTCP